MESIDREKFGAFIAALRKEQGLTQQELADRLFVSNKAVSKWERGQSLPDIALLEPLAQCLGVSVAELLRGERLAQRPLEAQETEELVGRALHFSGDGGAEESPRKRRLWRLAWGLSVILGGLGVLAFLAGGVSAGEINLVWMGLLLLIFGVWAVFFAPARLPRYYDENKITTFNQGPVRMNLAFTRIHNGNWPHMLTVMRLWAVVSTAIYPEVFGIIRQNVPGWETGLTALEVCLCLFLPLMWVAKAYE